MSHDDEKIAEDVQNPKAFWVRWELHTEALNAGFDGNIGDKKEM